MARKRANNEGSIYKRKNGVWRAQVTLDGERLNFSADTQKECREWLKKTIGQIDNGLTFSGANTTLREFINDWLVSVESALRPNTLYQYKQIVRDHILPALGKLKLKDLRPDHIQKMYDERIKSGFGPRTVRLIHAVLHRALVHAVKLGMIGRNPVDATTPPKYESKELSIYDENQVSQMLIAALNKRNEALYHLAITTGMRQAEILGLKWPDLEWAGKTLQVSRQLKVSSDGREYYFAPPKTKAGKRKVVLGAKTIEKLREHRERQIIEREITGGRWQDYDLFFHQR